MYGTIFYVHLHFNNPFGKADWYSGGERLGLGEKKKKLRVDIAAGRRNYLSLRRLYKSEEK